MAKIGIGTVAAGQLQSLGWKLIDDLVNKNIQYGFFTKDGTPFYLKPEGDTGSNGQNNSDKPSVVIGSYPIDTLTGAFKTFEKTLNPNIDVSVGVVNFNYSKPTAITNAPLMSGQFFSFNKVVQPRPANVVYVTTGTEIQRKNFEEAVVKAIEGFGLFSLYTGEKYIENMNLIDYSVSRDERSQQKYNIAISAQEVMIKANDKALGKATAGSGTAKESGELPKTDAAASQIQSAAKTQDGSIEMGGVY